MKTVIIDIVVLAVVFAAGVVFSTKIKDWFRGIPATVRADFNKLEAKLVAAFKKNSGTTGPNAS